MHSAKIISRKIMSHLRFWQQWL